MSLQSSSHESCKMQCHDRKDMSRPDNMNSITARRCGKLPFFPWHSGHPWSEYSTMVSTCSDFNNLEPMISSCLQDAQFSIQTWAWLQVQPSSCWPSSLHFIVPSCIAKGSCSWACRSGAAFSEPPACPEQCSINNARTTGSWRNVREHLVDSGSLGMVSSPYLVSVDWDTWRETL